MRIFENVKRGHMIAFGCGIAAAIVGGKILKSRSVRSCTVKAVAKGLQIKDEAQHKLVEIKEEAEDIYAEAKQQQDGCCFGCADAKEA